MSGRGGNTSDIQNNLQRLRVTAQPFVPGGGGGQYQPGLYQAPMYGGPSQYGGAPYGVPPPMMNYHPGNYYQQGYMSQPTHRQQHHTHYQDHSYQADRWQQQQQQQHSSPTKPQQQQHIVANENIPTNPVSVAQSHKSPDTTPPQPDVESWEDIAEDMPTQSNGPEEIKDSPPLATSRPTVTAGESSSVTVETTSNDGPRQETVDSNDKATPTTTSTRPAKDSGSVKSVKSVVPPPKTESEKENVNIVFIGHVDAGKSTIGGHIMYLTGQVDKRTLEKYEREAKEKNRETWYLSWALDTNQEERDKGKTVEVGRAAFETDKKRFTILDAPGHAGFVPNMISGAVQADVGVLVISARRGEFETGFERKGQTREHAMLAKTAGVKHLIVLINKMDDTTVNWSNERYEECKTKLTPFLKKVGFNPKTDVYFIPVSGLTGANLKETAPTSVCSWYRGPALIPYLNDLPSIAREDDAPFRMPIAEKYKEMGTIILGKVEAGSVCKGSVFTLMPNRTMVEVLSVIRGEEDVSVAYSGDNVKLKLKGIEEEDVSPGFVMCSISSPCHTGRVFDAQVVILEYKSIICAGFSCVLHIHTVVEEVEIIQLLAKIDKKTGKKLPEKPKFIKQDHTAIARFQTSGVICMEVFKEFPPMARFNLRDEGKTIAIGKILKIIE